MLARASNRAHVLHIDSRLCWPGCQERSTFLHLGVPMRNTDAVFARTLRALSTSIFEHRFSGGSIAVRFAFCVNRVLRVATKIVLYCERCRSFSVVLPTATIPIVVHRRLGICARLTQSISFWDFDINSPAAPKPFADFAGRSTDIDLSLTAELTVHWFSYSQCDNKFSLASNWSSQTFVSYKGHPDTMCGLNSNLRGTP